MTTHRQRREAGVYEPSEAAAEDDLGSMTKQQLLDYAQELGVYPANAAMTKDDLRAGVDAKLAEGS